MAVITKLLYFCIRSRIACYVCGGSLRDVVTCLTKFTVSHTSETVHATVFLQVRGRIWHLFISAFHVEGRKDQSSPK